MWKRTSRSNLGRCHCSYSDVMAAHSIDISILYIPYEINISLLGIFS